MNPQELLLVLTALIGRRLENAPDSAPSSLRLARERLAKQRAEHEVGRLWEELEARRSAPRSPHA
jgi:hypothetical protein